ncbi:hypothetical protein FIBSPDRAFT_1053443 [Athelia psychrophila]|uniref:Uncharacterized protein n=1 Tax=Athelia psychrophila TaxID=1759441 RepID=A0A167WYF4_9AGAM|nr:hypothetical protein FIBSPDRAFT_1053443 [Fibularhizoctonia sp. CBS 109695]
MPMLPFDEGVSLQNAPDLFIAAPQDFTTTFTSPGTTSPCIRDLEQRHVAVLRMLGLRNYIQTLTKQLRAYPALSRQIRSFSYSLQPATQTGSCYLPRRTASHPASMLQLPPAHSLPLTASLSGSSTGVAFTFAAPESASDATPTTCLALSSRKPRGSRGHPRPALNAYSSPSASPIIGVGRGDLGQWLPDGRPRAPTAPATQMERHDAEGSGIVNSDAGRDVSKADDKEEEISNLLADAIPKRPESTHNA